MAVVFCLCIIAGLCFSSASANGQVINGKTDCDPDSTDVVNAAKFAVTDYNRSARNTYLLKFMKVTSAQSQISAGKVFYLRVEAGRTKCRHFSKAKHADSNSCAVRRVLTCDFEVYHRPWENHTEVRKSSCF